LVDNDPEDADAESVSSVIKKINRSLRSASRASNKITTATKSNDNSSFSRASKSLPGNNDVVLKKANNSSRSTASRKTTSPSAEEMRNISRSSSRASQSSSSSNVIRRKKIQRPDSG
jgi:hypothetical protein